MKIAIIGGLPRSLFNFRGELLNKLASNTEIDVYTMATGASKEEIFLLKSLNVTYIDYSLSRNGIDPIQDFTTFKELLAIFKKVEPDVILAYTAKPIIWGGLASIFVPKCRFYALVTGLGFAFQKGGWKKNLLARLVSFLYRLALCRSTKVIFQNPDNRKVFIDLGIVPKDKTVIINGSGVNLEYFKVEVLPSTPNFLLIARLLGDKGIKEYIKAASIVKLQFPEAKFQLLGPEDPSPDGISIEELTKLNVNQSIEYLGSTEDVRSYLKHCSIFVLPSYHEGLPRTVLEAMAMGRPILTTDVPGCRETVVNGCNGWLVEKANVKELVEKMVWFIQNQKEWRRMGNESRLIVENKFDVRKVNEDLFKIMELNK